MSLGANIKRFRKLRGLTQEKLAEKANMSRSYLADVERDRYNPSVDTLKAIAEALNVGVDDLLESSDEHDKSVTKAMQEFGKTELKATENTYDYTKDQSIPRALQDFLDKLSAYPPEEQERIIKQINTLFELLLKEENRSN
ncbi:helix-turn-helix domain-containing protein [Brevibacillus borstelensis]|uniref:helix-turn-helix domain-containing protein n=1 Tax=Brevibacillus borstelensis TaxID=45462 RepID=UPI003CE4C5E9